MSRRQLSLRLWAQSHAPHVVGKANVLLEHGGIVLCLDATGIACIVCEAGGLEPSAAGLQAPGGGSEPWPLLQLHRDADGGAKWASWAVGECSCQSLSVAAARELVSKERLRLSEAGRRMVVGAIHDYYLHHVLEPSVAGFLSILEKQFARSDLYLFELLQNAVDEGAWRVAVELQRSPPGLRFSHDGACFTPLDVQGLASVGMSTKATKRTLPHAVPAQRAVRGSVLN